MDKQKSYGQNYQQTKLKHKFSLKFVLWTFFSSVAAVVIVAACVGVFA